MAFLKKMVMAVVLLIAQVYTGLLYSQSEKGFQAIMGISSQGFYDLPHEEQKHILQNVSDEKLTSLVIDNIEFQERIMAEMVGEEQKVELFEFYATLKIFLKSNPLILRTTLDQQLSDKIWGVFWKKLIKLGFSGIAKDECFLFEDDIEKYMDRNKKSIKKYPFFQDAVDICSFYCGYDHIPFLFFIASMINKDLDELINYKGAKKTYYKKVSDLTKKISFIKNIVIETYYIAAKYRCFKAD